MDYYQTKSEESLIFSKRYKFKKLILMSLLL